MDNIEDEKIINLMLIYLNLLLMNSIIQMLLKI